MVAPKERKMSFTTRKSASGTNREYFKGKHKKSVCAIDGTVLSGVPHGKRSHVAKHSKTEKRPSVPFGGILGAPARVAVAIELGKVVAGVKEIDDVDEKYRKYVKQMTTRAGK